MKNIIELFKSPVMIAGLLAVLILMIAGAIILNLSKQKVNYKKQTKQEAFYCCLYEEYKKFPVLKTYLRVMTKKLSSMSVYSKNEVKSLVSKYLTVTMVGVVITTSVALLIFSDIASVILCAVLSYILFTTMLEKRMERINYIVYTQLKYAMESIRLEYMRCNDVVEALETAVYGNRIAKIMESIHGVLISTKGELRLKEFFESTPFKPIQTLAYVCYSINNTGDEFDAEGNSTFISTLLIMNKDINQELERQDYQFMKFGKLEYLTLIPIPCIPLIQMFLLKYMPGTSIIIQGMTGYVIRILIIVACIYCYDYISKANSMHVVKEDDRILFIYNLLKYKTLKHFIKNITPKNRKRRLLNQKLLNAFSKKSIEEFYVEKLLYAVAAFTFCMLLFFSATIAGRNYMLHYTGSLSLISDEKDYNDKSGKPMYTQQDILDMDMTYIALRNQGKFDFKHITGNPDDEKEELTQLIRGTMPDINDLQVQDQKARLEKKYDWLQKVRFYWYYIDISFVIAVIGFFLPDINIKKRSNFLKEEEEEEFLQLQTIMTILMSMNCDTMEALEHLTQISTMHKDMLTYCYQGYASNPIKELNIMIDKTPIPDFKRFIEKMKMTVDELSLEEAFSDLIQNREHICNTRDEVLKNNIDNRRNKCGQRAKMPFMMTLILLFVFPLMYMGYTEMMSGINDLQGI
ncbi:hypothetical protein QA584_08255 [Anaerocolumna sp. AGMB13025]|uniref:hypothetical protein n=1 Tax=Anaerocolumna sp. AGMB13025 TaxID=3039116 RepID=UPI00241CA8BC|nr:hypothetical protein [Anaerocolumna sp. AGMB13025]WFR59063.1 hypothetical protein QA584_08255 [Anaerocolumna sp. AGMB13025]